MASEDGGPAGDEEAPRRPRRRHMRDWRRAAEAGTRALLDRLAEGDPGEQLRLGDLMAGLGRRAFGVLLLLALPPAFIPGVAGLISTPIVVLVGLQLTAGMRRPWLPKWLARRGPHRHALIKFDQWFSPWLARLERFVRPRMTALLDHRAATLVSGLLLVLLGLLLGLPIPLTNGIFCGLLLLFALALLERDGALMLVAWVIGAAAVVVFGVLSGNLAAVLARWVDLLH